MQYEMYDFIVCLHKKFAFQSVLLCLRYILTGFSTHSTVTLSDIVAGGETLSLTEHLEGCFRNEKKKQHRMLSNPGQAANVLTAIYRSRLQAHLHACRLSAGKALKTTRKLHERN